MSDLHVLIAGGGIGGLCLAQGLKKSGIKCTVFESTPKILQNGYRLHMNATGGNALKACLPPHLYEFYLQVSRKTPKREMFVVMDRDGNELGTREHIGPPNTGDRPNTAINRLTLRQILAAELGDSLQFGHTAIGFELIGDRVKLLFEDGSSAEGDILVGADGIHSPIRKQYLPGTKTLDDRLIGIWATAPLDDDLVEILPDGVMAGFALITLGEGMGSAVGVYDPRQPILEAAAQYAPGIEIDHVDPYIMFTYGNTVGSPAKPDTPDFGKISQAEAKEYLVDQLKDAHPGFLETAKRLTVSTIKPNTVRHLEASAPWQPSRVTLIGDAIHAMPPSFGAGANSALRDAQVLRDAIVQIAEGKASIEDAIGAYERGMREEIFPIMLASANPEIVNNLEKSI